MAGRASIRPGYDVAYHADQARDAEPSMTPVDYYTTATEAGGEPPGRWWGPWAAHLGFGSGQEVDKDIYKALYGERITPDGTRLGRPLKKDRNTDEVYAKLLAAEPHATAERRHELREEAHRKSRHTPLFHDLTMSFSKSISILHASFGERARLGDQEAARAVNDIEEIIYDSVHEAVDWFQAEAGYTRTGSHARRVDGRETGQWREADLAGVLWLQHTSRDGDAQLHVHTVIHALSRAQFDGKIRSADSYGFNEYVNAFGQHVTLRVEAALTRRFGVQWAARPDGQGHEIAGISREAIEALSSRRKAVDKKAQQLARDWEAENGRKPSQAKLAQLRDEAFYLTRKGKDDAGYDAGTLSEGWARKLRVTTGLDLAQVSREVTHAHTQGAVPSGQDLKVAAQKALVLAQRNRPTFTRADLMHKLGWTLPPSVRSLDPDQAAGLLDSLAGRILDGEFDTVRCLEAPDAVPVPLELTRADGRSRYRRHSGIRYTTRAQLDTEERLIAQAQREGAPRLSPEQAAALLGADPATLEARLHTRAADAQAQITQTGLRMDQAAALYQALTAGRRVTVINAPAGSGKTYTLMAAARAWQDSGAGKVIGITPSQVSRNTLAAGVASYNSARFLGDLPGQPGARGVQADLAAGDLIVIDEAEMMSSHHIAAIIGHADRAGARVIMAGDTNQLQAVESGGGMSMLARALGFVQLAEPVRFRHGWEQEATLRLRSGDASVLALYDEHGRISGAGPEQAMEEAARWYVDQVLDHKDALLMVRDHARRRELSRRIRDDLIHLGRVSPGPGVKIADGQEASTGDLVICKKNDHRAGIANGDVFLVEHAADGKMTLRRVLGADPRTGERRVDPRAFVYGDCGRFEHGYAITGHAALSRTVYAGRALITGNEDRQWAYVALSRGMEHNSAVVMITRPDAADPRQGARPDPELARGEKLAAVREGRREQRAPAGSPDALAVLGDVIRRDGQEIAAREYRQRELSNADHLGILIAQWADVARAAEARRYEEYLAGILPPDDQGHSYKARWLWRTLREAESCGQDPRAILAEAASAGSLDGARDVVAVIDSRIRKRIRGMVPVPQSSWAERACGMGEYPQALARAMDQRKQRIGRHLASEQPEWALSALGLVPGPDGLARRAAWEQRASSVGAYRELYGWDDRHDAIGPEPGSENPEQRSAWHEALAALGPVDGMDVRAEPDGRLWLMRDQYAAETAWAPTWVGDRLRAVRQAAEQARLAQVRHQAEAGAARARGEHETAGRHDRMSSSSASLQARYEELAGSYAATMEVRHEWEQATEHARMLAVAADAELRRRHPEERIDPLKSAEPDLPDLPDTPTETPEWITRMADERRAAREKLDERKGVMVPDEDPDYGDLREAWPQLRREREAVLQPPMPEMPSAPEITQRIAEREAGQ